ncbi:MAG: hypothetical protein AAFY99_00745 [Pseudomonadota bacterium]
MPTELSTRSENLALQHKRNAAYAVAIRHSALIARLRLLIPALVLFLTLALALAIIFLRPGAVAVISGVQLDQLTIDNGNLVMSNPRLEGVGDGNMPYVVQAEKAVQAGPTADLIELEKISAEVMMDGDLTGTLEAQAGTFEREANRLKLTESSVFRRSDGISAYFESADIAIGDGSMTSDEPVRVLHNGQEIVAGSAAFTDNGKRLVFGDGVKVTINPEQNTGSSGATR